MTTIYNYSLMTGEFTGADEAHPDPIDNTPLVPAHATLTKPQKTGANQVAIWESDAWSVEADYRGREYWLADGSHHVISEIGVKPPEDALDTAPPATREQQRTKALRLIDAEHARWLELLTGSATVAERDTWKAKEEAARAYLADAATPGQAGMLTAEAKAAEITETALAQKITAKADTFLALIGIAAGIRARSRAAIIAATADDMPLDQVEARITVALDTLKGEAETAAEKFAAEGTK